MSIEKAREALSRKITSRQEFETAMIDAGLIAKSDMERYCRTQITLAGKKYDAWALRDYLIRPTGVGDAYFPYYPGAAPFSEYIVNWPVEAWPLAREAARIWVGVYERCEALEQVLGPLAAAYGVHLSKAEPGMAAYTPDAAAAAADKQVRLAPGRLLRKLLPHAPDGFILEVEANVRAELSDELEIVTDPMEIMKVYTTLEGDSGCMRYNSDYFGLPKDLHPSMVYSGPGLGVAVVRDTKGRPKARSVVFINPDKPDDKRYVRLYGDPILRRRLERNGFKIGSLAGAKLAKLPHPTKQNTYVMPYIDPAGGRGVGNNDGRYVVLADDHILAITQDEAHQIREAQEASGVHYGKPFAPEAGSTSGYLTIQEMPSDLMAFTCAIDGKQYSRLTHPSCLWLPEPGADLQTARAASLPADAVHVKVVRDGRVQDVRSPAGTPYFDEVCDEVFVEEVPTREALQYWRLSPKHYPDDQQWRKRGLSFSPDKYVKTDDGFVKAEDAARLIVKTGDTVELKHVHKTDLPGSVIKLWSRGAKTIDAYAAEGVEFHTTRMGRKVHTLTHDIVQLWDGTWDFANKSDSYYITPTLCVNVLNTDETLPSALDLPGRRDTARRNIAALVAEATNARAALTRSVIASVGQRVVRHSWGGIGRAGIQADTTLEALKTSQEEFLTSLNGKNRELALAKYIVELCTMALDALNAAAPAPAPEQDRFAVAA